MAATTKPRDDLGSATSNGGSKTRTRASKASAPSSEPNRYVTVAGFGTRAFLIAGRNLVPNSDVQVETASGAVKTVSLGTIVGTYNGYDLAETKRKPK